MYTRCLELVMKLYIPFVSARTAYLYSSFLISPEYFYPLTVRVEFVVVVALDHNDIYHTHSVRLLWTRDRP